jgi:putative spermidine/putrescine transport system substrate-binding protein
MKATIGSIMLSRYNTEVVYQDLLTADEYTKLVAEKAHPTASVWILDAAHAIAAKNLGLLEKLDPKVVTNLKDLVPSAKPAAVGEYGGGIALITAGIAYRTDVFAQNGWAPPTEFKDLLDPKYKGHVGLTRSMSTDTLISMAKTNGGDEKNIDPAFTFAKQVVSAAKVSVFPASSLAFNDAMGRNEVWIGTQLDSAERAYKQQGGAVAMAYVSNMVFSITMAGVIKNSPNQPQAQQFVNLLFGLDYQTYQSTNGTQLPISTRSDVKLPDALVPLFPTKEQVRSAYAPDWSVVADQQGIWLQRWIRDLEGKAS